MGGKEKDGLGCRSWRGRTGLVALAEILRPSTPKVKPRSGSCLPSPIRHEQSISSSRNNHPCETRHRDLPGLSMRTGSGELQSDGMSMRVRQRGAEKQEQI